MAIDQFNAEKFILKITIPKTKILLTSIVATILITGMIFMSSPLVFGAPPPKITFCHSANHLQLVWSDNTVASEMGWLMGHSSNGDKMIDDGQGGSLYPSEITFEECFALNQVDPFDGFKTWTHTDYNWDQICDDLNDATTNVDPTTEECLVGFRDRNIYFNGENEDPDDDVLADSLDITVLDDNVSDVLVKVKGNGEIANMIPGAIYALTTVNILADIDMLQVDEHYDDCTDDELELLNQNKLSRNVKVAIADPDGYVTEVTDKLYDESDSDVEFVGPITDDLASVKINDSALLTPESTVFVLVKFDDQLEGQNPNILPQICMNTEDVTSTIDPDDTFELTFEAILRMTESQ